MKTVNVLFELGTEELPASCIKKFPSDLKTLISVALEDQMLSFAEIQVYISPRRIAVYIRDLLAQQADRLVEKQGPQEKIAFNAQGEPTAAGLGFARSCQIDPTQLKNYVEEGRLIYRSMQKGNTIQQLLPNLLTDCILQLSAGRTMRWENQLVFVRPIRWVVLLINDELLKTQMFGLNTQDFTFGHRFLAPEKIRIKHADQYLTLLETQAKVLVNQNARAEKILKALQTLPQQYHGKTIIDEDLLNEVTGLVEWPVALIGKFSPDFLNVPAEALISSMKNHQKCFPIIDNQQKLLPYFITISNLESKKPEQVIHGNERVMHARLSDAAFFFKKDKEQSLAERLGALSSIIYQEKLGSLYDKTKRVINLSEPLAELFHLNPQECARAASLSLCDLTTAMVQEFPELQGIMGSYYAQHDQESSEICQALKEFYLPRFSGDELPNSQMGKVLAIANRLDTLVGQFAAGNKPTGDKDPFSLRRQAQGLMRILEGQEMDLNVLEWITLASSQLPIKPNNTEKMNEEIWEFCLERLRALYLERGGLIEIFKAVAALKPVNPYDIKLRIQALEHFRQLPAANALSAAHKRVKNILAKTDKVPEKIDEQLLIEEAEKSLAQEFKTKSLEFNQLIQNREYESLLTALAQLRPHIDRFFDHVMVMVDDIAIRQNRLALLKQLHQYLACVADISELASSYFA